MTSFRDWLITAVSHYQIGPCWPRLSSRVVFTNYVSQTKQCSLRMCRSYDLHTCCHTKVCTLSLPLLSNTTALAYVLYHYTWAWAYNLSVTHGFFVLLTAILYMHASALPHPIRCIHGRQYATCMYIDGLWYAIQARARPDAVTCDGRTASDGRTPRLQKDVRGSDDVVRRQRGAGSELRCRWVLWRGHLRMPQLSAPLWSTLPNQAAMCR